MKKIIDNLKKKKEDLSTKFFSDDDENMENEKQENTSTENPETNDQLSVEERIDFYGKIFYVFPGFSDNIAGLVKKIADWFEQKKRFTISIYEYNNISLLQYKETKGLKSSLGLNVSYHLYIKQKDEKLYYYITEAEWISDSNALQQPLHQPKSNIFQESYEADIIEIIGNYITEQALARNSIIQPKTINRYFESASLHEKVWMLSTQATNEVALAFLTVSTVKEIPGHNDPGKHIEWRYYLSSNRSLLIGLNERNELMYSQEMRGKELTVKSEFGRNTVKANGYEWLTTRGNDKLFYQLQSAANKAGNERIRETARLNWIHREKDADSNEMAYYLIELLKSGDENPFDELTLLFLEMGKENRTEIVNENIEDERLIVALKNVLAFNKTKEYLIHWIDDWSISNIDAIALIQVMLNIEPSQIELNRLLPFHRKVRDIFQKENKDPVARTIFDITYAKHLIRCEFAEEAISVLEKNLQKLPDELISDLLPPRDVDLTGDTSGQLLRIAILNLLIEAKGDNKAKDVIVQRAKLQPLAKKQLDTLIQTADDTLKNRATRLKEVYEPEILSKTEYPSKDTKHKELSKKAIEKYLQHPATRKGGAFESLQNWLAQVKVPDYSAIKSFADALTAQNHPEVLQAITDIRFALNVGTVECFIARGEKGVGISSFEGDTPFLIIGSEHLNKESHHYMRLPELRFAIGVEFAHLYFKHSRITSNDVWQGAKDKGVFILDTLISILPGVGILGGALKHFPKFSALAKVLQSATRFTTFAATSKEALDVAAKTVNIYKGKAGTKDTQNEEQQQFLATSRIMQLSADRAGLLFCDDLKAAVRSMFLVSRYYINELPTAERYGLIELLTKQNEDGTYKYQELAIRLAAMFSFYLSDEYHKLRKELFGK